MNPIIIEIVIIIINVNSIRLRNYFLDTGMPVSFFYQHELVPCSDGKNSG